MNTFLQGCCFIPPEDDSISTPSFLELSPHLVPSSRSSSKANSCSKLVDGKEIIYIKRYPGDAWGNPNEDKSCVHSRPSSKSSLGLISSRKIDKHTSKSRTRPRSVISSSNSRLVLSDEEISNHGSSCLCQTRNQDPNSSSYMSVYGSKSPRRQVTSTGRLLDFISMCFWKCSPGCQQVSTINT